MVVFVLEISLVLASVAVMEWNSGDRYPGPALAYMLWGCILFTLGLLMAGIVLLLGRRSRPGWLALGFAAYGFLFLLLFLPTLARARTH